MKIHFLGTACGRPTAHRFSSSTAVEQGGRLLMIDCGEPCTALLKRQGLSPGDVTDIFVTHVHSDHVTGLTMLLREIRGCRKTRESLRDIEEPVNLFVPDHANPEILTGVSIFSGKSRSAGVSERVQIHSLADKGVYQCEGLQMTSYANRDDALESYAFYLEGEGQRIMHTGDLPGTFAAIEPYLDGLDLLIMEAAHLQTPAYAVLNQRDIKQIIVSHIRWKHHGQEEQFAQELAEQIPKHDVLLAADGMEYALS